MGLCKTGGPGAALHLMNDPPNLSAVLHGTNHHSAIPSSSSIHFNINQTTKQNKKKQHATTTSFQHMCNFQRNITSSSENRVYLPICQQAHIWSSALRSTAAAMRSEVHGGTQRGLSICFFSKGPKMRRKGADAHRVVELGACEKQGAARRREPSRARCWFWEGEERCQSHGKDGVWVDKAEQREERGRARSLKAECSRGTGGRFGVGHVEVGACTETLR